RVALPVYAFLSASVNFSIIWGLFLGFLLVTGRWPGWPLVAIVPLLLVQQVFALGLGLILGVTNVFFRDVAQAIGVALQFWFWLTPIVYPLSAVPERARELIAWNPLYPLIASYQRVIVERAWPLWNQLWLVGALAIAAVVLAEVVFRHLSGAMVD